MDGKAAALRVGLLILAALGLGFGLMLFLTRNRISAGDHYETYFAESVQGLDVGAPVKFRGVTLGQVTRIGLVSAEYGAGPPAEMRASTYQLVFVRYVIDPARLGQVPSAEAAIREGLRVRLASQGLTGVNYLELDFVSPDRYPPLAVPWTPRAPYIPSMPSTISVVQDAARKLLSRFEKVDVDALAGNVGGLVTELRGELRDGDAHRALAGAAELVDELRSELRQADLPALAGQLRGTAADVRAVVRGREMQGLLSNLSLAAARFAGAATQLPPLLTALQATARHADAGSADLEAELGPLLRDVRTAATNLRELSEALRRDPSQVLLGGAPPRSGR